MGYIIILGRQTIMTAYSHKLDDFNRIEIPCILQDQHKYTGHICSNVGESGQSDLSLWYEHGTKTGARLSSNIQCDKAHTAMLVVLWLLWFFQMTTQWSRVNLGFERDMKWNVHCMLICIVEMTIPRSIFTIEKTGDFWQYWGQTHNI